MNPEGGLLYRLASRKCGSFSIPPLGDEPSPFSSKFLLVEQAVAHPVGLQAQTKSILSAGMFPVGGPIHEVKHSKYPIPRDVPVQAAGRELRCAFELHMFTRWEIPVQPDASSREPTRYHTKH